MDPAKLAAGARATGPVFGVGAVVPPLRAGAVLVVLPARATGPRATNLTSREV
jgi:hypothetical protein